MTNYKEKILSLLLTYYGHENEAYNSVKNV